MTEAQYGKSITDVVIIIIIFVSLNVPIGFPTRVRSHNRVIRQKYITKVSWFFFSFFDLVLLLVKLYKGVEREKYLGDADLMDVCTIQRFFTFSWLFFFDELCRSVLHRELYAVKLYQKESRRSKCNFVFSCIRLHTE